MTTPTQIDPITTEILRNAFISIAQDMNATLIRSAYSSIIYEGKDCSVALLDHNGDVLGQSSGLPLFLGNLQVCVQLTAEMFGWDYFHPGDIFFMNDSYMAGTHLNDMTIFAPIYWNDTLVGFSASRAHWLDVGSKDAGGPMDSSEIYQEGMRWGPTRLYEGGKPREEIIEFMRRNSRFGFVLVGDMNAQIAAGRTGEQRFRGILDRFGYDTVLAARDEIFRQSEALERAAVSAIADGVYKADGFVDNDGLGNGPLPVKMTVTIAGDSVTIDLAGSSPQALGPVNCGFAQTISACRVAFKLLVNPGRPVDGGTFKTLSISAPEGSIFRAQEPAACQWYFTPLGLLIDLFVKSLTPVLPDAAAAAHYGDSMVIFLAGVDPLPHDMHQHDPQPRVRRGSSRSGAARRRQRRWNLPANARSGRSSARPRLAPGHGRGRTPCTRRPRRGRGRGRAPHRPSRQMRISGVDGVRRGSRRGPRHVRKSPRPPAVRQSNGPRWLRPRGQA